MITSAFCNNFYQIAITNFLSQRCIGVIVKGESKKRRSEKRWLRKKKEMKLYFLERFASDKAIAIACLRFLTIGPFLEPE